jgi:hypothetical protein
LRGITRAEFVPTIITGGFAIDHFLVSDGLASLALGLAALPTTFGLGGLRHAILADSFCLVGNLPTSFQLRPDSLDSVVTGVGLRRNHAIALARIVLQQRCDYLASLFGSEMAAMDVCADDVVSCISINASEVRKRWLDLR